MMHGDQDLKASFYTGMMNEGVLMFSKAQGALCTLTTEREVDDFVDASRAVLQRLRG